MLNRTIKHLSNLPGWRTNRKIVVIESDDWGSLRMPSKETYEFLYKQNLNIGEEGIACFNKYDTLASKQDLEHLFEVLTHTKDKNKHPAKITAVSVVANPDFQKIKANYFENYYFEAFPKTLARYNKADAIELWQQGIEENIFLPEYHGREHLNVQAWMRALQSQDKDTLLAFDQEVWGFTRKSGVGFQAAFDLEIASDLEQQKEILKSGLDVFEEIHGYKAQFFVPPNGHINNALEAIAAKKGVKYISTAKMQREVLGGGRTKRNFRYLGKKNELGQTYITRNAFFEPTIRRGDEVDRCLSHIEIAFKFKKPAIICSHRVNYIGGLDENNRISSLKKLTTLLKTIVKKWPEVEFMTSAELGNLITTTSKS